MPDVGVAEVQPVIAVALSGKQLAAAGAAGLGGLGWAVRAWVKLLGHGHAIRELRAQRLPERLAEIDVQFAQAMERMSAVVAAVDRQTDRIDAILIAMGHGPEEKKT